MVNPTLSCILKREPPRRSAGLVEVISCVSPGMGHFEVRVGDELQMSGRISAKDADVKAMPSLPAPRSPPSETLTGKEVLGELSARGVVFHDKYSALNSLQIGDEGKASLGRERER